MKLRPYQEKLDYEIHAAWAAGHRNVLTVSPTGSGKTVLFAEVLRKHQGASVAIAHRQELVGQISLALARDEVPHRIIGPSGIVREIVQIHTEELGRTYYAPNAPCAVAGVDTLISWSKPDSKNYSMLMRWANQVTKWVIDDCHHIQGGGRPDQSKINKWGTAVSMFPNALGLGVTATPERADGGGLGRHADGVFDHMVLGPTMRDLINGLPDHTGAVTPYLTDYRIACPPPTDFDLASVGVGSDGDYVRKKLGMVTRQSSIVGDVVTHYQKFANGKLGVTFAPDVETAAEIAKRFVDAGIPAEVVSAKTPGKVRRAILRQFRQRKILQLVNVDLFGEGFDLPAIEVVSMARATESYSLYAQQFGRALRLMDGKKVAWIIDHVGNVIRHGGPPDRPRVWTLDRRERRSASKDDGTIPMRTCLNPECMAPYERVYPACPLCGWIPSPQGRTAPEMLDGDLYELTPDVLDAMFGAVQRVDRSCEDVFNEFHPLHGYPIAKHQANKHAEKQQSQRELREIIAWWGGARRHVGIPDSVSYREFYLKFGLDVLTAQTLGRADADALRDRIARDLTGGMV